MVRADGTVASSGGKVVKNVAGYDLGKLFAGSYGTLGLIVEAAFRLHPLPGATSFVTLDAADAAAAHAAVAAAAASPLAPSAAEIDRPGRQAPVRVGVLLEGDADGVAERVRADDRAAGRRRRRLGVAGAARLVGRGAAAAPDGTVIRIAFWAAALAEVLGGRRRRRVRRRARPGGRRLRGGRRDLRRGGRGRGTGRGGAVRDRPARRARRPGRLAAPAVYRVARRRRPPVPGQRRGAARPGARCAPRSTCGARCPRSA